MQGQNKIKPIGGINLDVDPKFLPPEVARYLLNVDRSISSTGGATKGSFGKETPTPGNTIVDGGQIFKWNYTNQQLELWAPPAGLNTPIQYCESELTKEIYVLVHNSNNLHYIYRINGDTFKSELINQNILLGFRLDPKYTPRAIVFFNKNSVEEANQKIFRKYLVFVDGNGTQKYIDVEASFLTESFSIGYYNFTGVDPLEYISLGVRKPMVCPQGEFIDITDNAEELAKPNRLREFPFQIAYKYITYDGRESEWSEISVPFFQNVSSCQTNAANLPRCLGLTLGAGSSLVEKIVIGFRGGNGSAFDEANPTDFYKYDIVEKYNQDATEFFNRTIALTDYDAPTNTFKYTFCKDKDCTPIDKAETNRNFNPLPIKSYALATVDNNRLGLFNNVVGYDPFKKEVLDKVSIATEEETVADCKIEYVTIRVGIILYNRVSKDNQQVYIMEDDVENDQKLFGGLDRAKRWQDPKPMLQFFPEDGRKGFIIYAEGTEYYTITNQWHCTQRGTDNIEEVGPLKRFTDVLARSTVADAINRDEFYFQIGELRVPKGFVGIIRIAGHNSDDKYESTSTNVLGVWNLPRKTYYGRREILDSELLDSGYVKEMFVDTSAAVDDLLDTTSGFNGKMFIVGDLTVPGEQANWVGGYLRDQNGVPVPRAEVVFYGAAGSGITPLTSKATDHNGYYFLQTWNYKNAVEGTRQVKFFVEGHLSPAYGCGKVLGTFFTAWEGNGAGGPSQGTENTAYYKDAVVDSVPTYADNWFAQIDILVKDCNDVVIPDAMVVLSGQKAVKTDANGIARIVIRNAVWRIPSTGSGFAWAVLAMVMQNGGCYFTDCDNNCNINMGTQTIALPGCFSAATQPITLPDAAFQYNIGVFNRKGLKPGGRYGFAIIGHDELGRTGFIQTADHLYLDIPSVQKKERFTFSKIKLTIDQSIQLPPWVKYISVSRTKNLSFEDFIQWVVDKIEFIDSVGNLTTASAATKMRLSLQSLNDYNDFYNYSSNVKYNFSKGDRVQFIADQNGGIYDTATNNSLIEMPIEDVKFGETIVQKATSVTPPVTATEPSVSTTTNEESKNPYFFIVVPMDSRLTKLKEGALVQLMKAYQCETEQIFYGICPVIKVNAGVPETFQMYLDTFDTYQFNRIIRYNKFKHSFAFPFEHHSPSDFWGNHLSSIGRLNVKNPYEKQIQLEKTGYVSDVLLENGNLNGLSKFRPEHVKYFKLEDSGGIIAAKGTDNILLLLFERKNCICRVTDNFIRVDRTTGRTYAASGDEIISDPEPAYVGKHGVKYDDITTVIFGPRWAFWIDAYHTAPVFHDYQAARDVSVDEKGLPVCQSYFMDKMNYRDQYNAANGTQRRIITGFDPVSKVAHITFKSGTIPVAEVRASALFLVNTIPPVNTPFTISVLGREIAKIKLNATDLTLDKISQKVANTINNSNTGYIAKDLTNGRVQIYAKPGLGSSINAEHMVITPDTWFSETAFSGGFDATEYIPTLTPAVAAKAIVTVVDGDSDEHAGIKIFAYVPGTGWVELGIYTIVADDVADHIGESIRDAINANSTTTGFSATTNTGEVTITAPQYLGSLMNGFGILFTNYFSISERELFHDGKDAFYDLPPNINNEDHTATENTETIGFCIADSTWIGFLSYLPELYGCLYESLNGKVFFTFKGGLPWAHRQSTKYLEFFGVSCDQFIDVVFNDIKDKEKMPLALEIQSLVKYYAKKVTTDNPAVQSHIPPKGFVKNKNKWNGGFLRDENTKAKLPGKALFTGNALYGYYIRVLFVRDNVVGNNVNQFDDTKRQLYNELDAIIMLYAFSEQSGYKTNK